MSVFAQAEIGVAEAATILSVVDELKRAEVERHRLRVGEIEKVEATLRRLVAEPSRSSIDLELALSSIRHRRASFSPLAIVGKAAKGFGGERFTFEELCARVERDYPEAMLNRASVSRKLYQLREAKVPLVECCDGECRLNSLIPGRKGKQLIYRYIGPP